MTSVWGGMAHILDACGPCEYRDAPKTLAGLMHCLRNHAECTAVKKRDDCLSLLWVGWWSPMSNKRLRLD